MKKTILLFIVALFFVSCEESVPEPVEYKQIINLVANGNDWTENNTNGLNWYYSVSFDMHEINSTIYNKGAVFAFVDKNNVQQVLPTVRHYENAGGIRWTETIDYEYSNGKITFFYTASNFQPITIEKMNFRVILFW